MLSLAMIPMTALVVLAYLAITTKNRYRLAIEKIQAKLEKKREEIRTADQDNDRTLTVKIAEASEPIGNLFHDYGKGRGDLLTGAGVDPPHAWTFDHLTEYLTHQYQTAVSRQARLELFRAAVSTLIVLSFSAGLALAWYHFHSSPTAVAAENVPASTPASAADPFDSFDDLAEAAP